MMFNRFFRTAAAVALLAPGLASAAIADNATPAASAGDPTQSPAIELAAATQPPNVARGKIVFQTTANCVNCHGWPGDGITGKNPRSPGIAANLRETQLDTNSMIQVVSCGIPGSAMPYHDALAYKDKRCYGTTMADYTTGMPPQRGNVIGAQDIINVVAYVQQKIKGRGPITKAECLEYFGKPVTACNDYQ